MKLEALWIFGGRINCLLDSQLNEQLVQKVCSWIGGEKGKQDLIENDALRHLFQALLSKREENNENLAFNNKHAHLRVLLNETFSKEFNCLISSAETIDDLRSAYQTNDWKFPLIKNDDVWKSAQKGILVVKSVDGKQKHYWYKGTYTNKEDICLEDYQSNFRSS